MLIKKIRTLLKRQQGFTLIELLVVVAIMGILAAIAVPRYVDSTASANGAKILADLQVLDSASQQYAANNGGNIPTYDKTALGSYLAGGELPTPPTGKYKVKGMDKPEEITATAYDLNDDGRATFDGKTADQLVVTTATTP